MTLAEIDLALAVNVRAVIIASQEAILHMGVGGGLLILAA